NPPLYCTCIQFYTDFSKGNMPGRPHVSTFMYCYNGFIRLCQDFSAFWRKSRHNGRSRLSGNVFQAAPAQQQSEITPLQVSELPQVCLSQPAPQRGLYQVSYSRS